MRRFSSRSNTIRCFKCFTESIVEILSLLFPNTCSKNDYPTMFAPSFHHISNTLMPALVFLFSRSDTPLSLSGLRQASGIRRRGLSKKLSTHLPTRSIFNSVTAASSEGFRLAVEKVEKFAVFPKDSGSIAMLRIGIPAARDRARAQSVCEVGSTLELQCNEHSTAAAALARRQLRVLHAKRLSA